MRISLEIINNYQNMDWQKISLHGKKHPCAADFHPRSKELFS